MESYDSEKSTNKDSFKIFCTYSFNDLTDSQNLWSCESISPKTILTFPKNFIDLGSMQLTDRIL